MIPISLLGAIILLIIGLIIYKITGTPVFAGAMMACSADRMTDARRGDFYEYQCYQYLTFYKGAIVSVDTSGYAHPGRATATDRVVGVADEYVDNSAGASGAKSVRVKQGIFKFDDIADNAALTIADIGNAVYIYDDCAVAKTVSTRPIAGYLRDVDSDGVWVELKNCHGPSGNLLAANNLSEVTALTARGNLGANLVALTLNIADLTTGHTYYVASPVAGHITKLQAILNAALGTANATLTGYIATTPITTGAFTLLYSGSAAGDYFALTPSGANTVAVGSKINFVVTGSQALQVGCTVTILIATDV